MRVSGRFLVGGKGEFLYVFASLHQAQTVHQFSQPLTAPNLLSPKLILITFPLPVFQYLPVERRLRPALTDTNDIENIISSTIARLKAAFQS